MRKRFTEINDIVDDFRRELISRILQSYPERTKDDADVSNDAFLFDDEIVNVEADRIIIKNSIIPLKGAPIAGNPPRYREISDILADFEKVVTSLTGVVIEEDTRIPGTNILLEKGDKIFFKEEFTVPLENDDDLVSLLEVSFWNRLPGNSKYNNIYESPDKAWRIKFNRNETYFQIESKRGFQVVFYREITKVEKSTDRIKIFTNGRDYPFVVPCR